jgi:phospholipid/cholesterol/gamma-HCH transport system substrate-binding protein
VKLIASVLVACLTAGAVYLGLIKEDKYVVYADLSDAGGILKNYNVKVGEVPAGEIKEISLNPDDSVRLKMELDPDVGPIGSGASAKVRPVNLLGEKYVDLDPGDLSRPQPEGTVIPRQRTGVPVEIDDVLNVLDPDTRTGLRLLINEFGVSVAGRGADFNSVLEDLPPALDRANAVVAEVALETIVRGKDEFADLVGEAGRALDVAADRREQLGGTIRAASPVVGQLRSTLGELQRATTDLRPAARDLRTASPNLARTLERLPAFAKDADATLAEATRVAPDLRRLARSSTPTLRRLRPTADRLAGFSSTAKPLLDQLGAPTPQESSARSFLSFMDGWENTTYQRDSLGHVFRLRLTLDDEALTSALQRLPEELGLTERPRRARRSAGRQAADKPKAQPAPVRSPAAPRPEAVGKAVKGLTDGAKDLTDGVAEGVRGIKETVDGVVGGLKQGLGGGAGRAPSAPSDGGTQKLLNFLLGS